MLDFPTFFSKSVHLVTVNFCFLYTLYQKCFQTDVILKMDCLKGHATGILLCLFLCNIHSLEIDKYQLLIPTLECSVVITFVICYVIASGNISKDTQEMPQSRRTALLRHQRRRDQEQIMLQLSPPMKP